MLGARVLTGEVRRSRCGMNEVSKIFVGVGMGISIEFIRKYRQIYMYLLKGFLRFR